MSLSVDRLKLHNQLLSATGETVIVSSVSSGTEFEAKALAGQSGIETHNTAMPGYTMTAQHTDWLIAEKDVPEDYVPTVGDIITDAKGHDHQVVQSQDTSRPWRWSSGQELVMRIHTKQETER